MTRPVGEKMARNITYEVLVQQGGRWEIHARHRAAEKDAALDEAKTLERLPKITAVKVVKETYDSEVGETEEATVYKSIPSAPKKDAHSKGWAHSRVSPSAFESPKKRPFRAKAVKAAARRPPRPAPPTNNLGFLTKVLLVIFFSIAFATLLTGMAALFLREIPLFGGRISSDMYANILFGVFVVGFLFSAVPLALKFLSPDELDTLAAKKHPALAPGRPAKKKGP